VFFSSAFFVTVLLRRNNKHIRKRPAKKKPIYLVGRADHSVKSGFGHLREHPTVVAYTEKKQQETKSSQVLQ